MAVVDGRTAAVSDEQHGTHRPSRKRRSPDVARPDKRQSVDIAEEDIYTEAETPGFW